MTHASDLDAADAGPNNAARFQPGLVGGIEERGHAHGLVLGQLGIADIGHSATLLAIPDAVADDAVPGRMDAGDQRRVRWPGDAGKARDHSLGHRSFAGQLAERGQLGTRVGEVAGGQAVDADENDMLDGAARGGLVLGRGVRSEVDDEQGNKDRSHGDLDEVTF